VSPKKGIETKKELDSNLNLTENQVRSFDRFLVVGTGKALNVLDTMFMLNIDRSDSSIEIVSAANSEKIKHLGSRPLYAISGLLDGELQGRLHLLMRSKDFNCLSEVMKPILRLLFLSSTDVKLASKENIEPDLMRDDGNAHPDERVFHEQMMDTLTEMGNVLFGVYTSAIYKVYDLHTYHSFLEPLRDPDQRPIQQILSSQEMSEQHIVIENEFSVLGNPIRFWCLISPTQKYFQEILNRID